MNYGLYLSAAGMLTAMHRMDVASNNLANVNTVGFKPDFAAAMQRLPERVEDGLYQIDSNTLLEKLGGGTLSMPTRTNFTTSPPEVTNNPMDVSILGEGLFVLDAASDDSGDAVKFSRDGRFTIGPAGNLVSSATGRAVLSEQNSPIRLDSTKPVHITTAGDVQQAGQTIARLQIATVPDRDSLIKVGDNLYRADPKIAARRHTTGSFVQPGAVESSGVNPIDTMMDITEAGEAVRNNSRILEVHDEMMDRAINTFGRVN